MTVAVMAAVLLTLGASLSYAQDRPDRERREGDRPAAEAREQWRDRDPQRHNHPEGKEMRHHPPGAEREQPMADERRGPWRRPAGPPHVEPLDEAQTEALLDFLREYNPQMAERFTDAMKHNPERVRRALAMVYPRYRELMELREENPELYELRREDLLLARESRELVRELQQVRRADGEAEAERIRERLRDVVTRHFEVRQALRERELEQLERRLEALRDELEQRREERDELIEQRLEELTGRPELPRW
jgi:DNA repair exonuclease SbcCD ATPase subunit